MEAVATKHEMSILDETGDTKIVWDEDTPAEVESARNSFDTMKRKGYVAYRVNKKGDQGEVMDRFDPSAEKMILSPQMKGG